MYFGPSCTFFPDSQSFRVAIGPGIEDTNSLSFDLSESISQACGLRQQEVRERGKRERAGLKMQAGVRELRDSVRKARLATSRDRARSTRSVDRDPANLSISRSRFLSPFFLFIRWFLLISDKTKKASGFLISTPNFLNVEDPRKLWNSFLF